MEPPSCLLFDIYPYQPHHAILESTSDKLLAKVDIEFTKILSTHK